MTGSSLTSCVRPRRLDQLRPARVDLFMAMTGSLARRDTAHCRQRPGRSAGTGVAIQTDRIVIGCSRSMVSSTTRPTSSSSVALSGIGKPGFRSGLPEPRDPTPG